jgi:hypothetical protein
MEVPVAIAGAVTIAFIVVLGIFVYPLLLARRGGVLLVAAATLALTVLYFLFQATGEPVTKAFFAVLFALAPVLAGVIVSRIGRKSQAGSLRR